MADSFWRAGLPDLRLNRAHLVLFDRRKHHMSATYSAKFMAF
jgi:hypothetical protein